MGYEDDRYDSQFRIADVVVVDVEISDENLLVRGFMCSLQSVIYYY